MMEEHCCDNCEYCEVDKHKSCCVNVASEHCAEYIERCEVCDAWTKPSGTYVLK